jgi:hypothetical protein
LQKEIIMVGCFVEFLLVGAAIKAGQLIRDKLQAKKPQTTGFVLVPVL